MLGILLASDKPLASDSVSASLELYPVQVVTGKWGQTLISPIKAELCSSTGSQGVDLLLPKRQHVFCMGQKTGKTRSYPAGGLSPCGHLQQPPWSHGPSIQGGWKGFTMWTCEVTSMTLYSTETTSAHCGEKMTLSKFSNRGEIYWYGHLLLFRYNLYLLSKSGVITKLYMLKMVRFRSA